MFAIEAVLYIAYHSKDRAVRSSDITGRQRIPSRYLEPVLQELVHAGILVGIRGPYGGYRLGTNGDQVRLLQIAEAVRNTEMRADPFEGEAKSPLARDVVRPAIAELAEHWAHDLGEISIGDLRIQAERAGIEKAA